MLECTSCCTLDRYVVFVQVAQAIFGSGSDTNHSMVMSVRWEKPFTVLSVVVVAFCWNPLKPLKLGAVVLYLWKAFLVKGPPAVVI